MLSTEAFGFLDLTQIHRRNLTEARTFAVNIFVFGKSYHLFNCRSLRHSMFSTRLFANRTLLPGSGLMTVCRLLFTYLPAINRTFHTASLSLDDWACIAAVGRDQD